MHRRAEGEAMKPEQIDEWLIGIKNPADKMIAQLAILRAIEIEREEWDDEVMPILADIAVSKDMTLSMAKKKAKCLYDSIRARKP